MVVKNIIKGFSVLSYVLTLTLAFGLTLYGCTTVQSPGPTTPGGGSEAVATSVPAPDFEDIPIPAELKKDLGESFIYETPSIKTAIVYYDSFPGYLDHSSLIIYFKNNMVAQGWKLIDLYNYKEATLSFEKGIRRCYITIFDKFLQTKVVIKVGQMSHAEPTRENNP